MRIRVIEQQPVPTYRAKCSECQSLLMFERADVAVVQTTLDGEALIVSFECPVCAAESGHTPAHRWSP